MQLKTAHFLFPKRNCKPSDCEDGLSLNSKTLRFCVTDGASEAFDSRKWARLLAALWKKSAPGELFDSDQFIAKAKAVSERWDKKWQNKELPWYAEEKSKKGSYASFLGVEIEEFGELLQWRAIAIGDCCMFIQNGESFSSFPLEHPHEFGLNPVLIPTKIEEPNNFVSNIRIANGKFYKSEFVLLMSDAISNWYMSTFIDFPDQIKKFLHLLRNRDRTALEALIKSARDSERLRNDDIAIILVSFE